jgi:hypothetical protein
VNTDQDSGTNPGGRVSGYPLPPGVLDMIRSGHVAQVTVFCDWCGLEYTADYVGEIREVRIAAARADLIPYGWVITPDNDLCPTCAVTKEPVF